jgi:hypothetical protein
MFGMAFSVQNKLKMGIWQNTRKETKTVSTTPIFSVVLTIYNTNHFSTMHQNVLFIPFGIKQ